MTDPATLALGVLVTGMVCAIPETRIIAGQLPPGYYVWGGAPKGDLEEPT